MALISDVIPSMLQGMTQQPPELRNPTQGDLQINGVSHPTYGLGKRAGTDHVRVLPGVPVRNALWAAWIARDDAEMYVLIFDGTRLRVFDMVGNEYPVYPDPGTLSYLLGGDPRRTLAALTLGDTTLILNRTKTVVMKSTKSAAQVHKAVVFVKQGEYGQKYILRIDGQEVSYTTSDSDVTTLQTSHIAEKLKTEIETHVTLSVGFTVTYTSGDSHFVVTKNGGADFDIEARDSIGGTALGMVKSVAPSFSDLPPIAPPDLVVRVAGTNADSADDYWVKYDPERESNPQGATRGRWVETIAPDTPYQLDGSTLPHRLVRLQDDVVGTVTNTPNQIYFKFQQVEWAERVVGDENISPDPSFVGNQIKAMSLHQGRLVFAFKDRVVTSRTNDLFNFFRQTATRVLDDDPIDISVASQLPQGKVVNFRHALDYNDSLLMVADGAQ